MFAAAVLALVPAFHGPPARVRLPIAARNVFAHAGMQPGATGIPARNPVQRHRCVDSTTDSVVFNRWAALPFVTTGSILSGTGVVLTTISSLLHAGRNGLAALGTSAIAFLSALLAVGLSACLSPVWLCEVWLSATGRGATAAAAWLMHRRIVQAPLQTPEFKAEREATMRGARLAKEQLLSRSRRGVWRPRPRAARLARKKALVVEARAPVTPRELTADDREQGKRLAMEQMLTERGTKRDEPPPQKRPGPKKYLLLE